MKYIHISVSDMNENYEDWMMKAELKQGECVEEFTQAMKHLLQRFISDTETLEVDVRTRDDEDPSEVDAISFLDAGDEPIDESQVPDPDEENK